MEEIITIIICLIIIIITKVSLNIRLKDLKQIKSRSNEDLDNLSNKFPKDVEICRDILKKLDNTSNVRIVFNEEYSSCLYTVYNNTITIGKFKENYMKIQTIAHECIHSCQDKKMLWSNFMISNILNLYYIIIVILAIINKLPYTNIFLIILAGISFIQNVTRNTLEIDAMTKAPFVAKEYLENNNILTKQEQEKLLKEYNEVNKIGIPFTNYSLLFKNLVKIIICSILILI